MPSLSEKAGRVLRERVDVEPDRDGHAERRAAVVNAAFRSRGATARWRLPALAALATIAVALIVVFVRPALAPNAITFEVGADAREGRLGVYYAATEASELSLKFSDGTQVALEPGGGARVSRADGRGAAVLLEAGGARVHVAARPSASWQVHAGPYTVRVTGTAFRVAWDSTSATLELEMQSGAVVVHGPGVEAGVAVRAGERFVSRASARIERAAAPAQSAETAPPHSPPSSPSEQASADAPAAPDAPSPPSWNALVRRGDYQAVVRDAERRGIDTSIQTAGADELDALADAARFTGRRDLAQRALLALRTRFPATARATSAGFLLGRMLDDAGDANGALRWYEGYLSEAPSGPLAAEALGRRMLALRRLDNRHAARDAARRYLQQFPTGPYASVANELVTP